MKDWGAKQWITFAVLCAGGGIIYRLPYLREIYYIPMEKAFHFDGFQMGFLTSMYGIVNFILYIPGGLIADRLPYKKLVVFSFISSGLLGLWFATIPSYGICLLIEGLWAITTVFTFWPTLIKAIRLLAGPGDQGKLFGTLEGGRGAASAILSFAGLGILGLFVDSNFGLKVVIIFYSVVIILIGVAAMFLLKEEHQSEEEKRALIEKEKEAKKTLLEGTKVVIKMGNVWLVAFIVLTAYAAFSALAFLTPYVTTVFHMSVNVGAFIGIIRSYVIMALAPPIAGFIIDKKLNSTTKYMIYGFIVSIIFTIFYLFMPGRDSFLIIMLINMLVLSVALLSMKGVFFSPLDEVKVPRMYTGIAAGLISIIGYSPDMYINAYYGWLLDLRAGAAGYHLIFISMIVLCVIGLICGLVLFYRLYKKPFFRAIPKVENEEVLQEAEA